MSTYTIDILNKIYRNVCTYVRIRTYVGIRNKVELRKLTLVVVVVVVAVYGDGNDRTFICIAEVHTHYTM